MPYHPDRKPHECAHSPAAAMVTPPRSEEELIDRAGRLAGRTLQQAAGDHDMSLPAEPKQAKGWIGAIAETCLGASARNLSEPDFQHIGVELKTLPLGGNGLPRESTYVCTAPLLETTDLSWATSTVKQKLDRVLWLPVEADPGIPFPQRRFGNAFLWSPDPEQEAWLREDWEELMAMVGMGELDRIDARHGRVLQIRPKAADARALGHYYNEHGDPAVTLPRGFYLRAAFTKAILQAQLKKLQVTSHKSQES